MIGTGAQRCCLDYKSHVSGRLRGISHGFQTASIGSEIQTFAGEILTVSKNCLTGRVIRASGIVWLNDQMNASATRSESRNASPLMADEATFRSIAFQCENATHRSIQELEYATNTVLDTLWSKEYKDNWVPMGCKICPIGGKPGAQAISGKTQRSQGCEVLQG